VILGALIVVAGLSVALLRGSRTRTMLLATVIALDAIVLFLVPELSAPRSVRTDLGPVKYLKQHLGTSRFYSLGPLGPNYGSYFGLPSLNANDNPVPSAFSTTRVRALTRLSMQPISTARPSAGIQERAFGGAGVDRQSSWIPYSRRRLHSRACWSTAP
jgi:hypothetical protein